MSEFRFPEPAEREKRSRLLEMLDAGKVMLYVDPRRPGVDLPAHFMGEVAVPLNLSHRFGLDVFEIGPLAIRASLSFGGERHLCVVPYSAVFGYFSHADGSRVVFADALPPEVAIVDAGAREDDSPAPDADDSPAPDGDDSPAGHAGLAADDGAETGQMPSDRSEPRPGASRAPHLRLVE